MENFKVNQRDKDEEKNWIEIRFYLAFGFCEYENPEGTLRCIRLLNGWQIQDKKLLVSERKNILRSFLLFLVNLNEHKLTNRKDRVSSDL